MLRDFFIAYHACIQSLSHVQLFATPWTVAHQNPMSMGFSRQEFWSGLPFPSPGGLPDSGIKPMPPALAGRFFTTEPPLKPQITDNSFKYPSHKLLFLFFLISGQNNSM